MPSAFLLKLGELAFACKAGINTPHIHETCHETTPARQNETEGGLSHRLNLKQHLRYKIGKSSNVKFQLPMDFNF
jgi:hypothetical protein